MKFAIFGVFCALAVPLMAFGAAASRRIRGLLLSMLVVTTALGPRASIHLVTLEDYRGTEDGFIIHLADVVCVALVLALVFRFPARLRWWPAGSGSIAALFGLAIVSTLTSDHPQLGLFSLLTFGQAWAMYWCVMNLLTLGTPPIFLCGGFVATAILLTAVTMKQHFVSHIPRVSGFFAHSNTLPSYGFPVVALVLVWALCGPGLRPWARNVSVAAAFATALGIVYTLSRSAVVLLPPLLLFCLILGMRRGVNARTRRTSLVLMGCLVLAGLALSPRVLQRFAEASPASGAAREEFNDAAHQMADDHPLGVGPNSFSLVLSTDETYRRRLDVLRYESATGVCHNIYLLTAAELGWGGLALFLAVVARFTSTTVAAARRSRGFQRTALQAILAAWLCILATGSLEWVLRQAPVMDMCAITTALALCAAETDRRSHVSRTPHARPRLSPATSSPARAQAGV